MPMYEYKCPTCGKEIEIIQHINDDTPFCENCGAELKKLISNSHFYLVGNGWAKDGYSIPKVNKGKTKNK